MDVDQTLLLGMHYSVPELNYTDARKALGSFLFTGDDVDKPAGISSCGAKTRLTLLTSAVSGPNVLLLDAPTNNIDPASRVEMLQALANFTEALALVIHDVGSITAMNKERVLTLPDSDEDHCK